jgi:hypothetical protein
MGFHSDLQNLLLEYLAGSRSLAELREWAAPRVVGLVPVDPETKRAVYAMQRSFSDLDEGFLSEKQVKQNCAALFFPSPSSLSFSYVPFDRNSFPQVVTTSSTLSEERASVETAFVGRGFAVALV